MGILRINCRNWKKGSTENNDLQKNLEVSLNPTMMVEKFAKIDDKFVEMKDNFEKIENILTENGIE